MNRDSTKQHLMEYMQTLPIVDAHEHLWAEKDHVARRFSWFDFLLPYTVSDLISCGVPMAWAMMNEITPEEAAARWVTVKKLWPLIKHGAYARCSVMAAKHFVGVNDFTDDTIPQMTEYLNKVNTPGIYERMLTKKCNIHWVLNQNMNRDPHSITQRDPQPAFIHGCYTMFLALLPQLVKEYVQANPKAELEDYCQQLKQQIIMAKKNGAKLVKMCTSIGLYRKLDWQNASLRFRELRNKPEIADTVSGRPDLMDEGLGFSGEVCNRILELLPEIGLPVAFHTGVWMDATKRSPDHLFHIIERHPAVQFDVYHMGIPWMASCAYLGKNFPNAYLNLCWAHMVNPVQVVNQFEEWMEVLPLSKIFAFGGDTHLTPPIVWAHQQMTQQNLAEVLSRVIEKGKMGRPEAEFALRLWFTDNPKRFYGLD